MGDFNAKVGLNCLSADSAVGTFRVGDVSAAQFLFVQYFDVVGFVTGRASDPYNTGC